MSHPHPFSALLGIVIVAPLFAQAPVKPSPATDSSASKPAATTDTAVTWIDLRSKDGALHGKLPQLLKAEIAKAQSEGRTPFLEVGATWCGPCVALEASLHNKDIIDAFAGTYIIHLDANEWDMDEDLGPLGFQGGQIPAILAINHDAKVVSVLYGQIEAAPIKKFLQAHLWKGKAVGTAKVVVR